MIDKLEGSSAKKPKKRCKDHRELAARQHGLVSRRQLLQECGFSDDRIWRAARRGSLQYVRRGVYRLAGAPETWRQRLMAVVLWAGEGVVSHRAAGALWRLDGFPEGRLEITATKRLRVKNPTFKVHPGHVPEALTTKRDNIPVTTVPRTLVDLASDLAPDRWGRTVEDAVRKGLTTQKVLRDFLEREDSASHPGMETLRARLADGEALKGPSATAFQRQVRDLVKAVGSFGEEVPIRDGEGEEVARVDFLLDGAPVIVEADGRKDHSGRDDWWHDLKRRNRVTSLGYFVLHVTPLDLKTPEGEQQFLMRLRQTVLMCAAERSRTG